MPTNSPTLECGCTSHEGLGDCYFQVWEPPGYWHRHTCGLKAKHRIITTDGQEKHVCGIHKRVHDRRPLGSGNWAA